MGNKLTRVNVQKYTGENSDNEVIITGKKRLKCEEGYLQK